MRKVASFILFIALISLACSRQSVTRTTSNPKKLPQWILNRPVDQNYYTGIGAAKVNQENAQHIELAKSNALNDLVSEIEVTISGNSVIRQFEDDIAFKEEFESMSQASIKDNISGYELVASWGDDQTYWVYYRLSKDHYRALKNKEMDRAASLARDLYLKAIEKKKEGEYPLALSYYLKALNELRYYLNEEIFIDIEGEEKYLTNEIVTSILDFFSKTTFSIQPTTVYTKMGRAIDTTISFTAQYQKAPLSNLPFTSSFERGEGSITTKVYSNNQGKGNFTLNRVSGVQDFQEILLSMDVKSIIGGDEKESSVLAGLLSVQSTIPSALLVIKVEPVLAFYKVSEKEFIGGGNRNVLSNEIKKQLSSKNISFSETKEGADVVIELESKATKGKHIQSHNVYTVYLDTYLSIYQVSSGTKIFYKGFDQVRGQQVGSWDNALKEAQSITLEKVKKEIIPTISELSY